MDLMPLEQMLTRKETRQQHEARKRIIEERTMRLKLHISTLETINTNWIQYIQQVPATKRKEEDKYAQMVEDKRAMGENLEQSSIEIIIENKLPAWILDRVYQQKEEQKICKEVEVINLDMPEVLNKIVVLFDSGAQATCISKKLAKGLHLEDIDYETFAGFGNRNSQTSLFAKVRIGIKTIEADIIPIVATAVDYLTNKIRVISVNQDNASDISTLFPLTEEISSWKQPEKTANYRS
uniref:DUF1758 domain-containing protein n=1 Tax=Wuchereria bancrofti TaxID=6293 RepID=A0AAF5PMX5_WUCBA